MEKVQTNTYDLMGRLVSETHGAPCNVTITRSYDGAGNLVEIADGSTAETMVYDELNQLVSLSWSANGILFKSLAYQYL